LKKIIRIFPIKTSFSPKDVYCYFGEPTMFLPEHDEVHISTIFTWDKEKAKYLQQQWKAFTDKPVLLGGPAFDDPGAEFTPGLYLKDGCVITSRGCPNKCSFCFVPKRNKNLKELEIKEGNIVLDDNLLACSNSHLEKVFDMLSHQKSIVFSQGLESGRITDKIVENLCRLKIKEIWLSYDPPHDKKALITAVGKLKKYFNRNKLRCYVLIGYNDDDFEHARERMKFTYEIGCLPFAMLYMGDIDNKNIIDKKWREFQRFWTRPAIYKSVIKKPI